MNYRFKQNIYELSKSEYIQEDWYYRVYTKYGVSCFLRRYDAFSHYQNNNGYRIEIVNKWHNKNIKAIVDGRIDTERIRNNLSIKKTTKNQRKAIAKYNKSNTKQIAFILNKRTDADILDYLDRIDNKNGLIKELLREHIEQENNRYNHIVINNQIIESRHKYKHFANL